jgi:hypothetical protein
MALELYVLVALQVPVDPRVPGTLRVSLLINVLVRKMYGREVNVDPLPEARFWTRNQPLGGVDSVTSHARLLVLLVDVPLGTVMVQ